MFVRIAFGFGMGLIVLAAALLGVGTAGWVGNAAGQAPQVVAVARPAQASWTFGPGGAPLTGQVLVGRAQEVQDSYHFDYPADFDRPFNGPAMEEAVTRYFNRKAARVTPLGVDPYSCLIFDDVLALHSGHQDQQWHRGGHVCRIWPDADQGKAAMIGTVYPRKSLQPMQGDPHLACQAEAAVWLKHLAPPGGDVDTAICLVVTDEAAGKADVMVFRKEGEMIVTLASGFAPPGTAAAFDGGKAPPDPSVPRYVFEQAYVRDAAARPALREQAVKIAEGRLELFRENPFFTLESVSLLGGFTLGKMTVSEGTADVTFRLASLDDAAIDALNAGGNRNFASLQDALFNALNPLICGDPVLAALLDPGPELWPEAAPARYLIASEDGGFKSIGPLEGIRCAPLRRKF